MRIVANSGSWYVVQLNDTTGRVFDLERRRLFAPMSLVAILARGGWHEFSGDEEPVIDALHEAHDLSPERASQQSLAVPDAHSWLSGKTAV
jgi:hypothetical protein